MRSSSSGLLLRLLFAIILAILALIVIQSAWLALVSYLLNTNQSAALPVSSTPITGFAIPTRQPPASIGTELTVGNMAITATRVVRPADSIVGTGSLYKSLESGEQYLLVGIRVRCISTDETCRLTEFDFGLSVDGGRDYTAEFSSSFDGLDGLFEGGDIKPGESLGGDLVFIIRSDDTGLMLVYPRMYNFGASAEFRLDQ